MAKTVRVRSHIRRVPGGGRVRVNTYRRRPPRW